MVISGLLKQHFRSHVLCASTERVGLGLSVCVITILLECSVTVLLCHDLAETIVSQSHMPQMVDYYVLGLDIPVDYALPVQIYDRRESF